MAVDKQKAASVAEGHRQKWSGAGSVGGLVATKQSARQVGGQKPFIQFAIENRTPNGGVV